MAPALLNTTDSNYLLHQLIDDLPIFDKLCYHSMMFIYKCFFHSSSLVKFVSRHGVMFVWHKSLLGSNFFFSVLL